MEATQELINRQVAKTVVMHAQNGIFFAIKNNEIWPFVTTWIDLEGIMLSEISQTEKGKYHMIFTYMWNLKNTNEKTK